MIQSFVKSLLCCSVVALHTVSTGVSYAAEPLVFISAFSGGEQGAIHAYRLDLETGRLELLERTTTIENPFFFDLSPDGRFLYAVHAEKFGGDEFEEVAAFQLQGRTGKLTSLNSQSAHGSATCYVAVDGTGQSVVAANYSSGSVASFRIKADGSLEKAASVIQHVGSSVNPKRQQGPYAHSIVVSPDNRFAFAADLGADRVFAYQLDSKTARLTPNRQPWVRTPPGAGPRHLTFHPSGRFLYAINELTNSVTHFDYDAQNGSLIERETTSSLPADFDGVSYCADVKATPDGRFLYGTNRGHDSIAIYSVADDGSLTVVDIVPSLGKGPQNLAITADGRLLLCGNMPGDNVAVFRIDGQTGRLKAAGDPISIPKPSCIKLLP